ncbi:hypothetical protein CKQ79_29620, partial [Klebsiella pneumoniae]
MPSALPPDPGSLCSFVAEHGDYQATEIAAELMAKLYAASEEPLPSALP